ncbi:MAG: hypothetical protein NC401_06480 [Ruminococcus sp.]|nr:hypothetical protein [Ruminococcus sp.]
MLPDQKTYANAMFVITALISVFVLLVIALIIFIIVIAVKQNRANKAEEEKTMDELEQMQARIDNEKMQGNSALDFFQSQVIMLLTQIKSSNEHIEKHLIFFKTLAIIAIMVAAFLGFITIVSMFK